MNTTSQFNLKKIRRTETIKRIINKKNSIRTKYGIFFLILMKKKNRLNMLY